MFKIFRKRKTSKHRIEDYMTNKYGKYWLDQCLKSLENQEIRTSITKTLNLKKHGTSTNIIPNS